MRKQHFIDIFVNFFSFQLILNQPFALIIILMLSYRVDSSEDISNTKKHIPLYLPFYDDF